MYVKTVPYFKFIEPAFACYEISAGTHFDRHVFYFSRCNCPTLSRFIFVPFIERAFHLRIFCLSTASFFTLTANFYPSLQRFKRHLIEQTAVSSSFFLCQMHSFSFQISRQHSVFISRRPLRLQTVDVVW